MAKSVGTSANLRVHEATNLLTQDEQDMEGAGNSGWFGTNGGTVAPNTDHYLAGSQSIKCTSSAGAKKGGRSTQWTTASPSKNYTAAIFALGVNGGETIRLDAVSEVASQGYDILGYDPTNMTLDAERWKLLAYQFTTRSDETGLYIRTIDQADAQAQSWYIDEAYLLGRTGIGVIKNISFSSSAGAIDATDNSSTKLREYIEGDANATLSFTQNYDPGVAYQILLDAYFNKARTLFGYSPQGNTSGNESFHFFGYVIGMSTPSSHEAILETTWEVQIDSHIGYSVNP